jgi:hypothetical protein
MTSKRRQSKKREGEDEEEKKIREAARSMFASLFLGGWGDPSASASSSSSNGAVMTSGEAVVDQRGGHAPPAAVGQSQQPNRHGTDPKTLQGSDPSSSSSSSSTSSAKDTALGGLGRQVAEQVRNLIPEDRDRLRQAALYKEAYKGIQWQRDNYLVGREYANWRVKERNHRLNHGTGTTTTTTTTRPIQSFVDEIQFDEAAMAHPQFARLAAALLPSDAVKSALVPLLVPVVTDQLYPVAQQGLVRLVEGQGDNLHQVLKGQILQFLDSPQNRSSIKSSTRGYISTSAAYGE